MRVFKSSGLIAIVVAAILCASSNSFGAIGFDLERSFVIPGMDSSIQQYKFNDIDGDGYPEVLICDGVDLVLYSILNETVLFSHYTGMDTLDWSGSNYRIELGDVNRDSVADILFAAYFQNQLYGTDVALICFDGASGYADTTVRTFDAGSYWEPLVQSKGVFALQAVDINMDGYSELLFSYDHGQSLSMIGYVHLYSSFPEDVLGVYETTIGEVASLTDKEGRKVFVAIQIERGATRFAGGDPYAESSWEYREPATIDTLGVVSGLYFDTPEVSRYRTGSDIGNLWDLQCIGDLDDDTTTTEIMLSQDWTKIRYWMNWTPEFGWMGYSEQESSSKYWIGTYESSDSVTIVRVDSNITIGECAYLPSWPGHFLDLQSDRLIQYQGWDGVIRQQTYDIPQGELSFANPFGDNEPARLIAIRNDSIDIFALDVNTSVGDDPEPSILPISFELGQPHPNPFNGELTIPMKIAFAVDIDLTVYNVLGQKVATMWTGVLGSGSHSFVWNSGNAPSGVYFIQAKSAESGRTVKATLIK